MTIIMMSAKKKFHVSCNQSLFNLIIFYLFWDKSQQSPQGTFVINAEIIQIYEHKADCLALFILVA